MADAFGNWLAEAEVKDLSTLASGAPVVETKHPCPRCHGTGKYLGVRVHMAKSRCFACKGKGFFKTSAAVRAKGRASKVNAKTNKIAKFTEANKELVSFLRDNVSWNSFARSLLESLDTKGSIHPNGVAAAEKMMAKTLATRAAKDALRATEEAAAPTFDLRKIHGLFETALANGKNRRALLGGDNMKITPAPARGKNAGHLYVKVDGEYAGKVDPAGKFHAGWGVKIDVEADLKKIAADPAGEARLYGMRTGSCACCGRELTDPNSIAVGIGPICADKWGL
jgi:hypothetical protein